MVELSEPILNENGEEDFSKTFLYNNYYVSKKHNCYFVKTEDEKEYKCVIDNDIAIILYSEDEIRKFIETNGYKPVIGEKLNRLVQFTVNVLSKNETQ